MAGETANPSNGGYLKLLTWNIWFDILDREQRMAALIQYILSEKPDVVCLQEVVPSVKRFLLKCDTDMVRSILDGSNNLKKDMQNDDKTLNLGRRLLCCSNTSKGSSANKKETDTTKLSDYYVFSDNEIKGYGLLTLIRKKEHCKNNQNIIIKGIQFVYKDYSSSTMGRGLLQAILDIEMNAEHDIKDVEYEENNQTRNIKTKTRKLVIATSHLESLSNQNVRESQIKQTATALKEIPMAIFCGDFNFDSNKSYGDWVKRPTDQLENVVLKKELPDFDDTWDKLKETAIEEDENDIEQGYTFDGVSNSKYIKEVNEQMRYDRVMVRGMIPKSIEVVGKEQICIPQIDSSGKDLEIKISDHYGLLAEFEIQ